MARGRCTTSPAAVNDDDVFIFVENGQVQRAGAGRVVCGVRRACQKKRLARAHAVVWGAHLD